MYMDFHTHGKLAKRLPFSTVYTDWLFGEAKGAWINTTEMETPCLQTRDCGSSLEWRPILQREAISSVWVCRRKFWN